MNNTSHVMDATRIHTAGTRGSLATSELTERIDDKAVKGHSLDDDAWRWMGTCARVAQ